jgi:hypothetical protein
MKVVFPVPKFLTGSQQRYRALHEERRRRAVAWLEKLIANPNQGLLLILNGQANFFLQEDPAWTTIPIAPA